MNAWAFSFGDGPCPEIFKPVRHRSEFDAELGYGWTQRADMAAVDRALPDPIWSVFLQGRGPSTFRVATGPGLFRVEIKSGDPLRGGTSIQVSVPGNTEVAPPLNLLRGERVTLALTARVDGPWLDVGIVGPRGNWNLNALTITPVTQTEPLSLYRHLDSRWALPAQTSRGPRALIGRWRQHPISDVDPVPTGLTRSDYLRIIAEGIAYFRTLQTLTGAIIDPYLEKECFYSTPCFAYAAALAGDATGDCDLIEQAALAFDCASAALAQRNAPSHHEDFFPSPLAHAFPLLVPHVANERARRWRAELGGMNPFTTYTRPGGGLSPGTNWNCLALAGDFLLHQQGIRTDPGYSENSLKGQGLVFQNEFGLYAEGPMTYDAFPRAWLGDMLASGYRGAAAEDLVEALDRGALTSLLMQSANGEAPCGGRSSHHQWSDALTTAIFEMAAARYARSGDLSLAATFKRAARRAYAAVLAWQRPSGECWIVKNRADPAMRLGSENYSIHTTYNLLMLTAFGFAYEHAATTEHLAERATPAETGGHAVVLGEPFHKVVAAAAGTSAIVCTMPQPGQTPAGLIRVQFDPVIGGPLPGDASLADPKFRLPAGPRAAAVIGLAWRGAEGNVRCLADIAVADLSSSVTVLREDASVVRFRVDYCVGGDAPVTFAEVYELSARQMSVRFEVPENGPVFLLRWPVFAGDGAGEAVITTSPAHVTVSFASRVVSYGVTGTEPPVVEETVVPHRTGFVRVVEAERRGMEAMRLVVRLVG